jgi:hypothetical protein
MSSLYLVFKDNARGGEGTVFTKLVNIFGKVKLTKII